MSDLKDILLNNITTKSSLLDEEEYFQAVIMILILKEKEKYYFLLQKRNKNIRQGGEISFPGGRMESTDENIIETALRETREELGIEMENVEIIGEYKSMVTPMGSYIKSVIGFLEVDDLDDIIKINQDEVDYIIKLPFNFLFENIHKEYHFKMQASPYFIDENGEKVVTFPVEKYDIPAMYHIPRCGKDYKIYVYDYQGETVWGITAAFIKDIIAILLKFR